MSIENKGEIGPIQCYGTVTADRQQRKECGSFTYSAGREEWTSPEIVGDSNVPMANFSYALVWKICFYLRRLRFCRVVFLSNAFLLGLNFDLFA